MSFQTSSSVQYVKCEIWRDMLNSYRGHALGEPPLPQGGTFSCDRSSAATFSETIVSTLRVFSSYSESDQSHKLRSCANSTLLIFEGIL